MNATKKERLPEVSTHAYERNYGKKPRGYGSWAFCPAEHYNDGDYLDHTKFFQGTFAEARKAAREHYRGQTDCLETCT